MTETISTGTGTVWKQAVSGPIIPENYLTGISTWQVIIVLGIAISGLSLFVNAYDWGTGVNTDVANLTYSNADLARRLNVLFGVVLGVSIVLLLLGIFLAFILRNRQSKWRLVTFGIALTGVLGIIYATTIKAQAFGGGLKTVASGVALLVFIVLALYSTYGRKTIGETTISGTEHILSGLKSTTPQHGTVGPVITISSDGTKSITKIDPSGTTGQKKT